MESFCGVFLAYDRERQSNHSQSWFVTKMPTRCWMAAECASDPSLPSLGRKTCRDAAPVEAGRAPKEQKIKLISDIQATFNLIF